MHVLFIGKSFTLLDAVSIVSFTLYVNPSKCTCSRTTLHVHIQYIWILMRSRRVISAYVQFLRTGHTYVWVSRVSLTSSHSLTCEWAAEPRGMCVILGSNNNTYVSKSLKNCENMTKLNYSVSRSGGREKGCHLSSLIDNISSVPKHRQLPS